MNFGLKHVPSMPGTEPNRAPEVTLSLAGSAKDVAIAACVICRAGLLTEERICTESMSNLSSCGICAGNFVLETHGLAVPCTGARTE